jgi:hypothetical protein
MSWIRVPLYFGTLKVKPRSHLRREEMYGRVPVFRFGRVYLTWKPRGPKRAQADAHIGDV